MSEEEFLDRILGMFRLAERKESAAEMKGEWNGLPFFLVVCVGANAGLAERYARSGGLLLSKTGQVELLPPE